MGPSRQQSGLDYFVPVDLDEKVRTFTLIPAQYEAYQPTCCRQTSYSRLPRSKLTVSERFQPTLDAAKETRAKLAKKAKNTKYIQNGAIGLQVLLGSLTTGLSAVATTGRQVSSSRNMGMRASYLPSVMYIDGSTDDHPWYVHSSP